MQLTAIQEHSRERAAMGSKLKKLPGFKRTDLK